MKYVCNDIAKSFKVKILQYAKRMSEMHDLKKYPPPPLMKGKSFQSDSWDVSNKEFYGDYIQVAFKYGLPSYIQDQLEDNQEEYCSLGHEYWC